LNTWQLQEAKSKFSELINLVSDGEPQRVSKNGKTVAYVVSAEEYERVLATPIKRTILARPHKEVEISVDRRKDGMRDIDF